MKLVWTKSNKALSHVIRFLTGDDCSHFSIVLYEDKPGQMMFESNLLGVHPCFYQSALKTHTIVHEVIIPTTQEQEDRIWDKMVKEYDGRPYDFMGAIYLGYRCFIKRIFGIKKPLKNKYAKPGSDFCSEMASLFSEVKDLGAEGGMLTPHDIYELVKIDV